VVNDLGEAPQCSPNARKGPLGVRAGIEPVMSPRAGRYPGLATPIATTPRTQVPAAQPVGSNRQQGARALSAEPDRCCMRGAFPCYLYEGSR
jgi:hypothetical protein